MRLLLTIPIALSLISCAQQAAIEPPQDTPAPTPYPSMEHAFIPDNIPLSPPNSTDLQKLALTLPVFETSPESLLQWVTKENGAVLNGNTWSIVANGAQSPVEVQRRPSSPTGAQRIRAILGPGLHDPYQWTYDLERTTGGWNVLNKSYQKL